MKSHLRKNEARKLGLFIISILSGLTLLSGQKLTIKGQLKESQNMMAVQFATVALRKTTDSTFITGTTSNKDGEFNLDNIDRGNYKLMISFIGYHRVTKTIQLHDNYDTGIILLQPESLILGEVNVSGERLKAREEVDKTTYFMNKKMYEASNNGVDILGFIPGIQVDIMKNISLEGSSHILILVDGKERDRNFLSQLNASKIDKVEVINSPGSKYDADVTGVINVILKRDKLSGIDGHIHLEVPTSESEIYVFPDYSLNYSSGKINLYTSYDGDLSYFNIVESCSRNIQDPLGNTEVTSDQIVRQKYWSHRFHFGLDFNLNPKNQLDFYAFCNPYSSEHSGNAELLEKGERSGDQAWSAIKRDDDINFSAFYTLNYKHLFNRPGREITFDLSYYNFEAVNSTAYITTGSISDDFSQIQVNKVKPAQNAGIFKIDYMSPVTENLSIEAGIKVRSQMLKDRQSDQFRYEENIFSLYGEIKYSFSKYTINAGMRAERSTSGLIGSFSKNLFVLQPDFSINYKVSPTQSLKLSYNRSIRRPNIYELNPYRSGDDPFSVQNGNPYLKAEFQQYLTVDFSKNIDNNYVSARMFYLKRTDAINNYTFINDDGIFETGVANLGNIEGYGFQIGGALKIHKAIALNPFLKLTGILTHAGDVARQYNISSRHRLAFDSGISAIVTFKHDIVASFNFQYSSPLIQIQTVSFSDALYIISLEKGFRQKFKVGISSAMPLARTFTYHGSDIKGINFNSYSEGNIRLSAIPLWLKFTYNFDSGKISDRFRGNTEDIGNMPKRGF